MVERPPQGVQWEERQKDKELCVAGTQQIFVEQIAKGNEFMMETSVPWPGHWPLLHSPGEVMPAKCQG